MKHKTPFYIILFKVLHAQRGQSRPFMETIGLSPGQPKLLNHLAQHGECLQKELAAALDVEPGTISKLLWKKTAISPEAALPEIGAPSVLPSPRRVVSASCFIPLIWTR